VDGTSAAPDWNAVAAAVEPSVVSVRVAAPGGNGEGSGVVLDTRGRILTNNHVIAAAAGGGQITVVLFDGRTYAATIVGRDATTDLAVIAVTGPPSDLKPATLGDSSAVRVGDPVMAVGNPLGLSDTVTTGIVSALVRPVTTSARQEGTPGSTTRTDSVVTNAIQTDAAVNPGNSGGALVDAGGRVIGITSSIASLGTSAGGPSGSIGLGFAIPVNEAKDVAAQLQDGGTVSHAFLGVTLADGTATVDGTRRQAAVIGSVTGEAPAARAGLAEGDAVVALDGRRLDGADSLVARIRALRPGTAGTLTAVRDGASREVEVTLGTRPAAG
jgi:putative serine protease PepD